MGCLRLGLPLQAVLVSRCHSSARPPCFPSHPLFSLPTRLPIAGRRGYVGAYELPPSQNPTPAKPGKGGKAAAEAAAAAAAMQALKSPGKRTRGGSSRQAVVAEVHESPAKKQRRAPARRG